MIKLDFSHPIPVHFVGIGGISMSGLAGILKHEGFTVTGSDREESDITKKLEESGIPVAIGQKRENVDRFSPIGLAVCTAAVHADNEEVQELKRQNIPMITRAELLGQLMDQYGNAVAVAGTHGKTTTTAMISQILAQADMDPTVSVGAVFPAIGGNVRIGGSDTFVAEACEYTNSFLSLSPSVGVILNVEADHLDFFKDLADIRASFKKFADRIRSGGTLVIGADIESVSELYPADAQVRVITFGLGDDADIYAENLRREDGQTAFTAVWKDGRRLDVRLHVPGDHNVKNALAALAVAEALSVPADAALRALSDFSGTARRFERLGEKNGVTIVDDYAHHPTEIRATLTAARSMGYKRIICAFQSHTYSRTKALMDDFASALSLADRVVLSDIYAARETDTLGISPADLQEKIRNLGTPCDYFPSFSAIQEDLTKKCCAGDLLIFMGAGIIDKIGYSMLSDG